MQSFAQMTYKLTGLHLSTAQLEAFSKYEKELLEWNSHTNLTAIRSPEEVRVKHFLDSLTCLLALRDSPVDRLVDIGTGAGFPGIPLKIIFPNTRLTLVDSVGKKTEFCRYIVKMCGMEGVEILQERAENLGQLPSYREKFDWAVARAVASLRVLAEFMLPLVHIGGSMLAMKGESAPVEAQAAERALRVLGGRLHQLIPVTLPCIADERYLVVVKKVAATPESYPRRVGLPVKHPL